MALGPVTVGVGGQYGSDQEAAAALASMQGIDLADPDSWDELFEEALEDDGLVII